MASIKEETAITLLNENNKDIIMSVTNLLLQICDNIINNPNDVKYRRLRLANKNVTEKLLPYTGAIECLFEMGFEEGDDSFVYPSNRSPKSLVDFKIRLIKFVSQLNENVIYEDESSESEVESSYKETSDSDKETMVTIVPQLMFSKENPPEFIRPALRPDENMKINPFLQSLFNTTNKVLNYEDRKLHEKARKCVPLEKLWTGALRNLHTNQAEVKTNSGIPIEAECKGLPDLFLIELLNWFKYDFFSWVDSPNCEICKQCTNYIGHSTELVHLAEAPRTELYTCSKGHITPFHRYSNVNKLLDTRRGRCGEYAGCFTVICRALGFDAREVEDSTDHVWTEVWSVTQKRWLHCDPCEAACDTPLIYSLGWKKQLTYCIAYSRDDIQDVTWRYTQEPMEVVLKRRTLCSETHLIDALFKLRTQLQDTVSSVRKKYLERRAFKELIELLNTNRSRIASSEEFVERQSGSLAWRQQRGEAAHSSKKIYSQFIWKTDETDLKEGSMSIQYSASTDSYKRRKKVFKSWKSGIYEAENINKKEERDWKKVYLARNEHDNSPGWIKWKFELSDNNYEIDTVTIDIKYATFKGGIIKLIVFGDQNPNETYIPDGRLLLSDCLKGCKEFTLIAELSGGEGNVAWQHTQLFRQDLDDLSNPFNVQINLKKK